MLRVAMRNSMSAHDVDELRKAIAKAVAAEREACAQVAEASFMTNDDNDQWDNAVRHVAYGIRARSNNSN